jgi:hypothetical protein
MHKSETDTQFLNVDLHIRGNAEDVEDFLRSVETSVIVLNHTNREASFELTKHCTSLDKTLTSIFELIDTLQPEAMNIWKRLDFRSLNVGIQARTRPHAAYFPMSTRAIQLIAIHQCEVLFTVYAPLPD